MSYFHHTHTPEITFILDMSNEKWTMNISTIWMLKYIRHWDLIHNYNNKIYQTKSYKIAFNFNGIKRNIALHQQQLEQAQNIYSRQYARINSFVLLVSLNDKIETNIWFKDMMIVPSFSRSIVQSFYRFVFSSFRRFVVPFDL